MISSYVYVTFHLDDPSSWIEWIDKDYYVSGDPIANMVKTDLPVFIE